MPETSSRSREWHLNVMKDVSRWTYAFLPIRRELANGEVELGYLVREEEFRTCVFRLDVFDVNRVAATGRLQDADRIPYSTFAAMIADGWEVD